MATSKQLLLQVQVLCCILALAALHLQCAAMDSSPHVIDLDEDNFDDLVTANSQWIVAFYAPYCVHCKKLGPVFEEAASELQDTSIKFAKVDATTHTRLARRFDVKAYPSIKFFRDGEDRPYRHPRTKDGFVSYVNSMLLPAIINVDKASFETLKDKNPVILLLLGANPDAKSADKYFNNVARAFQGVASFAKSQDEALCQVFRVSCQKLTLIAVNDDPDHDFRSITVGPNTGMSSMRAFVESSKYPLVSSLGAHNFEDLTAKQRAVIGVMDPSSMSDEDVDKFAAELRHAAKRFASKFSFGVLDGKVWNTFMGKFDISAENLPTVFVFDADNEQFWRPDPSGPTSAAGISTFLEDVLADKVATRGNTKWTLSYYTRSATKWLDSLSETQLLVGAGIIVIVFFGLLLLTCSMVGPTDDPSYPPMETPASVVAATTGAKTRSRKAD